MQGCCGPAIHSAQESGDRKGHTEHVSQASASHSKGLGSQAWPLRRQKVPISEGLTQARQSCRAWAGRQDCRGLALGMGWWPGF